MHLATRQVGAQLRPASHAQAESRGPDVSGFRWAGTDRSGRGVEAGGWSPRQKTGMWSWRAECRPRKPRRPRGWPVVGAGAGEASHCLRDLCSNFLSPSVLCARYKVTSANCPGRRPASC